MRNIGIVTTWFERGAAYVSKQYKELLEPENEIFIYARGGEEISKAGSWKSPNVKYATTPRNNIVTYIDKKEFKQWIEDNKIEIVFFNEQHFWLPVIWCKEWGVTVGSYIDYYTEVTVPFFGIYDFLICNTKRHQSVFESVNECSYYIPWGTNISLFKPQNKREIDSNKIVFFNSCGHNPKRKGVQNLIKVFHDLIPELNHENVKLLIHTQKKLEIFLPELKEKIDTLVDNEILEEITDTVTAPGLYHYGDVYCYLSVLDGIGLTLPEAISCGLPAIVPDNAPMNEFVVDGENGKIVSIDRLYSRSDGYYWPQCSIKEESLKESIRFYIENKKSIPKLKQKTREYALNNLNWQNQKEDILNIFSNVSQQKLNENLKRTIELFECKKIVKDFTNIRSPKIYFKSMVYLMKEKRRY